jgi:hypothetical protein
LVVAVILPTCTHIPAGYVCKARACVSLSVSVCSGYFTFGIYPKPTKAAVPDRLPPPWYDIRYSSGGWTMPSVLCGATFSTVCVLLVLIPLGIKCEAYRDIGMVRCSVKCSAEEALGICVTCDMALSAHMRFLRAISYCASYLCILANHALASYLLSSIGTFPRVKRVETVHAVHPVQQAMKISGVLMS